MIHIYNLKRNGNDKVSENFAIKEFACKDGSDEVIIDNELVAVLQSIRTYIRQPIHIVSGYRTEEYNKKCGGASNSYHLKGMAADIRTNDYDLNELAIVAALCGARGIGIYEKQNFIHVDIRPTIYIFKGENNER